VTSPSDEEARLAEGLRLAHRRVAASELDDATKARAVQRLLALSDAAKHDTTRAATRLDRLLSDLESGRVAAADDPSAES
jgi:hypothetical protein